MAASENALTRPIFELGICSLHKNGVEFDQDCNGNQLFLHTMPLILGNVAFSKD